MVVRLECAGHRSGAWVGPSSNHVRWDAHRPKPGRLAREVLAYAFKGPPNPAEPLMACRQKMNRVEVTF